MDNVIGRAAQNLKGRWHQGSYTDDEGHFCGIGAIAQQLAEENGMTFHEITHSVYWQKVMDMKKVLDDVAAEQFYDRATANGTWPLSHFPFFNDHEDTTVDDVVTVMEKAAVKWEERV